MIKDERWPVARLIPISSASGVEAQERRAASALLSVITGGDGFGRALLKPLGVWENAYQSAKMHNSLPASAAFEGNE